MGASTSQAGLAGSGLRCYAMQGKIPPGGLVGADLHERVVESKRTGRSPPAKMVRPGPERLCRSDVRLCPALWIRLEGSSCATDQVVATHPSIFLLVDSLESMTCTTRSFPSMFSMGRTKHTCF